MDSPSDSPSALLRSGDPWAWEAENQAPKRNYPKPAPTRPLSNLRLAGLAAEIPGVGILIGGPHLPQPGTPSSNSQPEGSIARAQKTRVCVCVRAYIYIYIPGPPFVVPFFGFVMDFG